MGGVEWTGRPAALSRCSEGVGQEVNRGHRQCGRGQKVDPRSLKGSDRSIPQPCVQGSSKENRCDVHVYFGSCLLLKCNNVDCAFVFCLYIAIVFF